MIYCIQIVPFQGSSFISRSRARISGMISEREDEEERDVTEERKTTSLEVRLMRLLDDYYE